MRRSDPWLGRERELDELGRIFSRTSEGEGGLLLLVGEAGVGKTRLAGRRSPRAGSMTCGASPQSAARRRTRPSRQCSASASTATPPPPSAHTRLSRTSMRSFPTGRSRPGVTDRETLLEALRRSLRDDFGARGDRRLPRRSSVGDAATLELLASLAQAAEAWPLLVLGAYRSEEIPRGHPLRRLRAELRRGRRLAELNVEPLDPDATARIAARVLEAEPGPTLRRRSTTAHKACRSSWRNWRPR
jgi:hypothetical protein